MCWRILQWGSNQRSRVVDKGGDSLTSHYPQLWCNWPCINTSPAALMRSTNAKLWWIWQLSRTSMLWCPGYAFMPGIYQSATYQNGSHCSEQVKVIIQVAQQQNHIILLSQMNLRQLNMPHIHWLWLQQGVNVCHCGQNCQWNQFVLLTLISHSSVQHHDCSCSSYQGR